MKTRSGFVSNSSSSSFIIEPNEIPRVVELINTTTNCDYYLLADGRLVTSEISDSDTIIYNAIYDLGTKYEYGHIDIMGDRGYEEISLRREEWLKECEQRAKMLNELSYIENEEVQKVMDKYKHVWEREVRNL